MELKALSWNIWLKGDIEGVVAYIRDSNADIATLQEVMPEREPNIVEQLESLGYHSTFFAVPELRKEGKQMGNAIFSKYPIRSSEMHVLSETDKRIAVSAEIDVEGTMLHAFSTHLLHSHLKSSETQELQAKNLLEILPTERVLLMGDFNATPESEAVRILKNSLIDTDPDSRPTWSVYPALECHGACNPQGVEIRFDYIFISEDLKTRSFEVGDSKASDHLPISVVIEM